MAMENDFEELKDDIQISKVYDEEFNKNLLRFTIFFLALYLAPIVILIFFS